MFTELQLEEPLIKAVKEMGYTKPTDIQQKAIPIVKAGRDLVGQSETGSGKTAAFGLPLLEKVEPGRGIQALILVPTRELAEQVCSELKKFSKYKRLNIIPVYGGVSITPQMDKLRFCEIVVATPGRTIDHLERRTINLSKVKILVLDEADRMLEMGFIDQMRHIMQHIPEQRQTLLFSATMPPEIQEIARHYLNNPEKVKTSVHVDKSKLTQGYHQVGSRDKVSLLIHLIKETGGAQAIVFCATREATDFVARNLYKNQISSMAIHGGLSQAKRTRTLEMFHHNKLQILVATDVAARGLDIKDVGFIFNFDIPKSAQDYTHRIGRTARAGASGKAVSLLSDRDHDNFRRILEDRSLNITPLETPQFERVQVGGGFSKHQQHGRMDFREGGHRREGGRFGGHQRSGEQREGPSRFGQRGGQGRPGERSHGKFGGHSRSGDRREGHSERRDFGFRGANRR